MPRWISITVADLEDAKVAALVTALRERALGAGQTDPTPRVVQGVVDEIRRKIGSWAKNKVDADETTIPAGLRDMAVDLVLERMKGRLEIALEDDERRRVDRHVRNLDRIASGQDAVEQPDEAIEAPVQSTAGTPSVTGGRNQLRRDRRSGL